MKQEDKKYEEWLTEIKNKQPILENPEELTAAILNKITDNAPKKKKIRYLVGAWISGTAATLLLFFIYKRCLFSSLPFRSRNAKWICLSAKRHFISLTGELGRNATLGEKYLPILSIHAAPEAPADANTSNYKRKPIKINRV